MEQKGSRKYNTEFRKKIIYKFEKIKNKSDYIDLYNIIYEDIGANFSSNRNGLFINMNVLSDKCISKLIDFLDDKFNLSITQSENEKISYKSYKKDDDELNSDTGHKLSNQDKSIIKRFRNKVFT